MACNKKIKEIEKRKLLLVEGKDEENFFKIFLRKHNINEVQIIEIGGKDQLNHESLTVLKNTPGFDELISLAIVQDADKNADTRFQSIRNYLRGSNLNAPDKVSTFTSQGQNLRIGIFIIPDGKNKGMLESLCLSTVIKDNETMTRCFNEFTDCLKQISDLNNGLPKPKNIHKAYLRAFLSAMEEDTPSLGIATQKGYWNLNSDRLAPLLNFLKKL